MRRLFSIAIIILLSSPLQLHAYAGVLSDIRAEQGRANLTERQLERLERKRAWQEMQAQKREEDKARKMERTKAIAEARAAKEAARMERLAQIDAAKAAKAQELADKKTATAAAKEEVRLAREAEKQAKIAAVRAAKEAEQAGRTKDEQTASIFDTPAIEMQPPLDPKAQQQQEWEDNLDGWIDTDEGTRPAPRQEVELITKETPGTIIISTTERKLYFVLGDNRAIQYGIGVGRPGFEWMGVKSVTRKEEWPDWRPPEAMIIRRPDLPRYMPGGPTNPLGARAMYLGSTLYRIHGSNEPESIGQAVSSGCFRMVNADVVDLYGRAQVGAKVVVR